MLIKDACMAVGLTKKAVEYYVEQGLIAPAIHENGYRDFSSGDIDRLRKISVLRKLGLGTEDIRSALEDVSGEVIRDYSVRNHIRLQRDSARQALLDRLGVEQDWDKISAEIEIIDKGLAIAERLLDAFPGYYGRFVCLHFARFLLHPIETRKQREAYEKIVRFLDNLPTVELPEDVREYLSESIQDISAQSIDDMDEKIKRSVEEPEAFLLENKETLDWYLAYKKSDEFRNSPAYRLQELLKGFNAASGYNDVFIPAMKDLSPSYAAYCRQLESANEVLRLHHPDID
jgi:DNA-binding transcriptional MerR regulator